MAQITHADRLMTADHLLIGANLRTIRDALANLEQIAGRRETDLKEALKDYAEYVRGGEIDASFPVLIEREAQDSDRDRRDREQEARHVRELSSAQASGR